jgi:hypothetical protein
MKNKKIIQTSFGIVAGTAMMLSGAVLVFAEGNTGASARKAVAPKAKINTSSLVEKSNKEIEKRVKDLNKLEDRILEMKNVSDAEKKSFSDSINSEISNLDDLKGKIGSSTDMTTLKSDVASITKDTRIYALVIPKMHILAANDKAMTAVNMLNAMVTKLQTRISDAQANGKDVTALNTALADLSAKLADATSLSGSISSGISTLVPDQGNKTVMSSNEAALKAARKNISLINADLSAARKDVNIILKGVKGVGPSATAAVPPTTSTTTGAVNQ